eukprot:scaffold6724_cov104-Isochrysis_galbana.AAC.6
MSSRRLDSGPPAAAVANNAAPSAPIRFTPRLSATNRGSAAGQAWSIRRSPASPRLLLLSISRATRASGAACSSLPSAAAPSGPSPLSCSQRDVALLSSSAEAKPSNPRASSSRCDQSSRGRADGRSTEQRTFLPPVPPPPPALPPPPPGLRAAGLGGSGSAGTMT